MEYVTRAFSPSPPPERRWTDDISEATTLSFKQRLVGFAICFSAGLFFCFISTWVIMFPRQFAKFYSLGSCFILLSTFFLVGPFAQIKNMFQAERAIPSAVYIGAMILTLVAALKWQITIIALVAVAVQILAAFWYGISYIPYAQTCLWNSAKTVLPVTMCV